MGRRYSAVFEGVNVSAQQDFFELNVPSTAAVIFRSVVLGVGGAQADTGDAKEQLLRIRFRKGNTTSGSGGTIPTAAQLGTSAAYAGTVEVNNTTKATAGTAIALHADTWNTRSQFLWIPPPEMIIELAPSSRFCVELATTPAEAIEVNGTLYFEAVS